ncbi:MAG: siphovirus Gp157 family protein [SAR324 cluster bacterium]|nr:siphovirus Gp157 family protein [SAR324 cluster bacterium]
MQALQVLQTETIFSDETKQDWNKLSLGKRSEIFSTAMSYLDTETTDEEFDLIAETEQALKDKLIACGHVAQKYDQASEIILSEAQALEAQVKTLKQRAEVFSNRSQARRQAMLTAMIQHGFKKLETPLMTVSLRQKPARVLETRQTLEDFDVFGTFNKLLDSCRNLVEEGINNETFKTIEEVIQSIPFSSGLTRFLRLKAEWNKTEISKELKAKRTVEGFAMSEPEFSITIK